jgi:hypothetical protein
MRIDSSNIISGFRRAAAPGALVRLDAGQTGPRWMIAGGDSLQRERAP